MAKKKQTKVWKLRSTTETNEDEENMEKLEKEMGEIHKSLNFMSGEISNLTKQYTLLQDLMTEVKKLNKTIQEKDEKIASLEKRLDDIEQYSRMEDVIISGLTIKPRSYARAVAGVEGSEESSPEEQHSVESQLIAFFETRDIHLDSHTIAACHTLPRKDKKVKPAIIVRFANRKHKVELLKQWKKLKDTEVFMSEHLTKKNGEIAKEARDLKREGKIQATWTRNFKVMIKLNGEEGVRMVRNLSDLNDYR